MKNKILLAILVSGFLFSTVFAQGESGTPLSVTKYGVTLKSVQFKNTTGNIVPYISNAGLFDIASVAVGGDVASLIPSSKLPPGTYNKIIITISDSFALNGVVKMDLSPVNSAGPPETAYCCTAAGPGEYINTGQPGLGYAKKGALSIGTQCLPVADNSVGLPSLAPIPLHPTPTSTITRGNGEMVMEMELPTSFTVTDTTGGVAPKYALRFNVSQSIGAIPVGVPGNPAELGCVIFPLFPDANFSVG